jgi:hypothetical protein
MREGPSLVPAASDDFYLVINRYGRFGTAFAETDLRCADLETTISDLISGQHSDPLRVVMFSPETDRAADASKAIAREILRRLDLEGREVPSELEGFIDGHVGPDRQLTLRLLARAHLGRFERGPISAPRASYAAIACFEGSNSIPRTLPAGFLWLPASRCIAQGWGLLSGLGG